MNAVSGWVGVDLDGTLAQYEGWLGHATIGEPVPAMLMRVQNWLAAGYEVRIFTARCYPGGYSAVGMSGCDTPALCGVAFNGRVNQETSEAIDAVRAWVIKHVGQDLAITCIKDHQMLELWDDRAVQVEPNTGRIIGKSTRGFV